MSWPRVSLLASLLFFVIPQAFADAIVVNTTLDDNADNDKCSLREAVEYFNQGRPAGGWQGCKLEGSASSTDSISLPADSKDYVINGSAIRVRTDRNLSISGNGYEGSSFTRIRATGNHRIFVVDNSVTYLAPDCAATATCQPANAPELSASSDTGDSATDWLTPVPRPVFGGLLPVAQIPAATFTTRIFLYAKRLDSTAEPKELGHVDADWDSVTDTWSWSISPAEDLAPGEYQITHSFQTIDSNASPVGSKTPGGAATTLRIYNDPTDPLTLSVSNLILEGCGAADCAGVDDATGLQPALANGLTFTRNLTGTAGNGGVIFTNENLSLNDAVISKGAAFGNGGAVYAAGDKTSLSFSKVKIESNSAGSQGAAIYAAANVVTTLEGVLLKDNSASSGAVVYMSSNSLGISTSSIVENTALVAVYIDSATAAATSSGTASTTVVVSSTFSGNSGVALSLKEGSVNSSTIVDNAVGIDFNGLSASVHNSIVAGNSGNDCDNDTGGVTFAFSLVGLTSTCPVSGSGMQTIASADVLATSSGASPEQFCDSATGILCPLSEGNESDKFLPFHLPRILFTYANLAASPVINKGAGSTGVATQYCASTDQRDKARGTDPVDYCDIGAIEVQKMSDLVRSGGTTTMGHTYSGPLNQNLGDEELMPAGECPAFFASWSNPPAWNNAPGCPWLEMLPPRGTVTFNLDGTYTYTPTSSFHGYDEFRFRVITSISRLNDTEGGEVGRLVSAKVISEPAAGMSFSKLGGSMGLGIFGVLALLGFVRSRKGQ